MTNEPMTKRTRRDSGEGARPYRKNGQTFSCTVCGDQFYRKASLVARGVTRTCGKRECLSVSMQKENNPFWGKNHSPEVKRLLKESKAANPASKRRSGPPKGFKHSSEARKKMSEALRKRWTENRNLMLSYTQCPPRPREEQRYRKQFTPWQRKNWKAGKCLWCESSENLVLDHIVSVMDGGHNVKENSQTLCQPCNLWKSVYVDRPAHLARLSLQRGLSC